MLGSVIGKTKKECKKLFEEKENLYKIDNILDGIFSNSHEYSNKTNLLDEEWFRLSDFSKTKYAIDPMKRNLSSIDFAEASVTDAKDIDFIFVINDNHMFFQKVTRNAFIKKRSFITLGERFEAKVNQAIFQINAYPDAIYDRQNDILYFKKLFAITRIFNGINELYREATMKEVEDFLSEDVFKLANGFSAQSVKIPNRKRIAMVQDSFSAMPKENKKSMFKYIKEYYPDLKEDNERIIISNENDLKNILYGLDERFYTTYVSKQKRIANSVVSAEVKKKKVER